MADVTLTYKGDTILELNDSDEKVLNTSGKYLEDNILLNYIKSSGGGGSSYVENESGTIGVELSDENCRIYFNGFTKTASDLPIADAIGTANDPNYRSIYTILDSVSDLYSYDYVLTPAYDTDKTTQIGWIGLYFQGGKFVRSWTMDKTTTLAGTFWGVIDLLNANAEQNNPYVEPPRQLYTNIIKGTSNPPSSMGNDGNEYLQYGNVRDGSNPITHAYVKVNGSWQNLLSSVIEDVDNTVDFSYNTSIIGGNNEPNSGIGNNGNVYLKYNKQDYPDGYTALDYIGVGNEKGPYIDTGVLVTSTSYFEVVSQYTDYPEANEWVFGTYSPNKDTMYGCYPTSNSLRFYIGGSGYDGILDLKKHTYKADSYGMFIDGVNVGGVRWSNVPASNTYYVFTILPQLDLMSKNVRVFSVKIWDNTTLVRNMIPVKRNSDNEVGMYDLVNGVFYTNSGTGSFVTGKVSANSPIEEAYVKVSNNWQPLVGSDVDDVSNSGMYTGTEAPPPDSLGSDGDYYYQRNNWQRSIQSVNLLSPEGSQTTAYGNEFTVTEPLTVMSLFAMTVENRTGKIQFGTTSEILVETETVTFPANEWVEVALQSPIQLTPGTNYLVKANVDIPGGLGYGRIAYFWQDQQSVTFDRRFSYVLARYGTTWPGTAETHIRVLVGISYLTSDGLYRIRKQFYKDSGVWSEIT